MSTVLSTIRFGCPRSCTGLVQQSCNAKLKFVTNIRHAKGSKANWLFQSTPECSMRRCKYSNVKIQCHQGTTRNRATGADGPYFPVSDDLDTEPFWLWLAKELIRGLKSVILFLCEQPGQLQYIEWPSFQSTLKTATLTVLLVILLIILLSSVDSALSYLLASTLRRGS